MYKKFIYKTNIYIHASTYTYTFVDKINLERFLKLIKALVSFIKNCTQY